MAKTKPMLLAAAAATVLLAGCADRGTDLRVNAEGAARAAVTPPDLEAVAQAMNARAGSRLGDDLTLTGARAEGNQLVMDLRHDDAESAFTPAARDAFTFTLERDVPMQMCAAPATRRFVEEEGGVRISVVTSDGAPLASRTITTCA
ncbi:hypothetical protein OCGS_0062 [Oceaniovalibus guishaninsula JLT2003]|uniref:Lipoprotein n=1 Tax=Oceaniovalibus guishaninsula JLT2003 TaxID=1231392 RepID=K2GTE7_9RHOB|nr:hypothetical protein [Oceaniovalibus guishaninsula]EKE45836.1 hypothetical protein OCGS_0062 [Oceaniovalibus guishaninsula JLT2003]